MLENGLPAPYFLKKWVDLDQTGVDILLGHGKEVIIFGDLIFKVTGGL